MNKRVYRLVFSALLAAAYAALTMGLGFMSYNAIQFRISEALCILPFFFPFTTWGLFVGCFLANLITGNILDIVFGSLATLLSCLCIAALGRSGQRRNWLRNILACLMPVLWNAVIVGLVLAYSGADLSNSAPFWLLFAGNALSVGFGELVVMFVLGLPLLRRFPRSRLYAALAEKLIDKQD